MSNVFKGIAEMFQKTVPVIIIAVLLIIGGAFAKMYFLLHQRVTLLEADLLSQSVNFNQMNQLQSQQTKNLSRLSTRLDNVDYAVSNYVSAINQDKNKLTAQIEKTNQAVSHLLDAVARKEQVMDTLIPAGSVIAYAGHLNTYTRQQLLSAGWLVCDGQTYPIEDYPALYQAIREIYGKSPSKTFQVPDYRGMFLRGLDLDKHIDPKRRVGSYQTDSYAAHTHEGHTTTDGLHDHEGVTIPAGKHQHRLMAQGYWFTSKLRNERRAMTSDVDDNQEYWTSINGEHLHGFKIENSGAHTHSLTIANSGTGETRPKNYPVIYLIKF